MNMKRFITAVIILLLHTLETAAIHNQRQSIKLALKANTQLENYEEAAKYPERKLIIVTCMDARINLEQTLGLQPGEAHILRNAGAIVTSDMIRSILLSIHALGTNQIMVINHTDCGVKGLKDRNFRENLIKQFGTDTIAPEQFYGFNNLKKNVLEQVQKIKSHPWIPKDTIVEGFIADVSTGKIIKVR